MTTMVVSTCSSYAPKNKEGMYGLDRELAQKRAAKYDVGLEQEVRGWIEQVTGQTISSDLDFFDQIKSGILLCKVAEAIKPGCVKYKDSKMPFVQMENINSFVTAVKSFGVPSQETFMTVDLFEKKNTTQVLLCLTSLTRHAPAVAGPDWNHPILGAKLVTRTPRSSLGSSDEAPVKVAEAVADAGAPSGKGCAR